jgi:hypothetical protein
MKNKKLTYFLIAAVAAIWALVIYRIFAAVKDDDDPVEVPVVQVKEAYNDYTIPKDTVKLLLNYRDPFGLVRQKDTVSGVKSMHRSIALVRPAVPGVNWSFITYAGYVRNPESKKLVTLLSINGQSYALRDGDMRDRVKLLKNRLDSIEVSYQGKTKFIVKR